MEELSTFALLKWFQYTFVSTYITFIAQTRDPWDVPVMQAVDVMQKIWNMTSSFKYKIMTSTPVYQKVHTTCPVWGNTDTFFRLFNAVWTHGAILLGPLALLSS